MTKARTIIHSSHVVYVKGDFTREEINRNNVISSAVINDDEKICKYCGDHGDQLVAICCNSEEYRRLSARGKMLEENLRNVNTTTNNLIKGKVK